MFTKVMTARLVELIKERTEELFPSSRKANAAITQAHAWKEITEIINIEFPENAKTVKQVQCKWKNVRQEVKDDVQRFRRKYNINADFRINGIDNDGDDLDSLSPNISTTDHLTLFLENMIRTQNVNSFNNKSIFSEEGVSYDADGNQTNYNEAPTSSNSTITNNSPFVNTPVDFNGDVENHFNFNRNGSNGSSDVNSDAGVKSLILTACQQNPISLSANNDINLDSTRRQQSIAVVNNINNILSSVNKKRKLSVIPIESVNGSDEEDDIEIDKPKRSKPSTKLYNLKYDVLQEKLTNAKKMSEMLDNANKFLCTAISFIQNFNTKTEINANAKNLNESNELKLPNGKTVHDNEAE